MPRSRTVAAMMLTAVCLLPPLYLLLMAGAKTWVAPNLLPTGFAGERIVDFFTSHNGVRDSLWVSLLISTAVAAATTPLGYLAARLIAYGRNRRRTLTLLYAPYAFSPVILGTTVMFFYIKVGLVGNLLGVILAQSIFAAAYAVIFFIPFWNPYRKALEEQVYTLGGNRLQAFTEALWPISRGMLLICFIQTFLISWSQYGLTLLIGAGKVQTLPIKVFQFANEANPYYAALASCLLILPPMVLIWINKRFIFAPR